ncbi:hypothetical protein ABZX40_13465 [Streptomyces sp. NPDC004610]|uniref:hypothetical protein n=1 Tax=unclassified Streptomyces TaxID=2593676 RepID=UPI0033A34BFC
MSRLVRTADRLGRGSSVLARRLAARHAARIRRTRRDDLTGLTARLGPIVWTLASIASVVVVFMIVRAQPRLMWVLTGCWACAAWRAGKPSTAPAKEESPLAEPAPGEGVHRFLLDVMGDADEVQLRTVLAHLQDRGQWEGRTVTHLRRHLEGLGVPCDRGVKAGGRSPTWGVRRRDLGGPSPVGTPGVSPVPSTAA